MATNNTILLATGYGAKELEGLAATVLTPGMFALRNSAGSWKAHDVADGTLPKTVVVEDIMYGKSISDGYAIGDRVYLRYVQPGDEVLVWLASSQTIVIGDLLTSNGAGMVKAPGATVIASGIAGIALEAVTTVATSARIKIEIV